MANKKMTRQERRQLLKMELKEKMKSGEQPAAVPTEVQVGSPQQKTEAQNPFTLLAQDIQKLGNYAKNLNNNMWLIVETLSRKGILDWQDVRDTEKLFTERDILRKEKIKRLISSDLSIEAIMEEIKEEGTISYETLNINPIKDLNLNPFEVGEYIREKNPDLKLEEYLKLGQKWGLQGEHFGFKKEEKDPK